MPRRSGTNDGQGMSLAEAVDLYANLVEHLAPIRQGIGEIWKGLNEGEADLAVAAVATDAAIDLAGQQIDGIMPLIVVGQKNWQGGFVLVVRTFATQYAKTATSGGGDKNTQCRYADPQVANDTYIRVLLALEKLAKHIQPGRNALLVPELITPPHDDSSSSTWSTPYSSLSTSAALARDHDFLQSLLCEALAATSLVPQWPAKDNLLRGVSDLARTGRVPFRLVFAAQVHLDIHHILSETLRRPTMGRVCVSLVSATSHFLLGEIETYRRSRRRASSSSSYTGTATTTTTSRAASTAASRPKTPDDRDILGPELQALLETVKNDPVGAARARMIFATNNSNGRNNDNNTAVPDNALLELSPLLCGLLLFRIRDETRAAGLRAAESCGSLTGVVHLLRGIEVWDRAERQLSERMWRYKRSVSAPGWRDLEVMVRVSSSGSGSSFFAGRLVAAAAAAAKGGGGGDGDGDKQQQRLWPGTLAEVLVSFGAAAGVAGPEHRPRSLLEWESGVVPVSAAAAERYRSGRGGGEAGDDDEEGKGEWTIDSLRKLLNGTNVTASGHEQRADSTTKQLVGRLAKALQGEVASHAFPYVVVHRKAWEILCSMTGIYGDYIEGSVGTDIFNAASAPRNVVPAILTMALGSIGRQNDGPLRDAAGRLRLMIAGGGREGELAVEAMRTEMGIDVEEDEVEI